MDSEDERCFEERDRCCKEGEIYWGNKEHNFLEMRLYEKEESTGRRAMARSQFDAKSAKQGEIATTTEFARDFTALHRTRRFFRTLEGFHKGILDLTGRHKRRYYSILSRWNRFLKDLNQVSRQATIVWEDDIDYEGNPVQVYSYTVSPAEVLGDFEKRWRISSDSLPLAFIFKETDKVLEVMAEHPIPKFQKLLLQDLPPELVHEMMRSFGLDGARRLGACSRFFREVSQSYVYESRSLQLAVKIEWEQFQSLYRDDQKTECILSALQGAQKNLLRDLDFLCNRNDILRKIRTLRIIGHFVEDDFRLAGILNNAESEREYFFPLLDKFQVVIREAINIQTLSVSCFKLSEAVMTELVSLNDLRTIELRLCQLPPAEKLQPSLSVQNALVSMTKQTHRTQWRLLFPFVALRNLTLIGGRIQTAFPPNEVRQIHNPFKTLQRFFVSGISFTDSLVLSSWIREAALPVGPGIRLTHFKFDGGREGLKTLQIRDLLRSLSTAPMQCFALEGIHDGSLDLFDDISASFPNLISLSLSHRQSNRQTKTRSATWPNASWEYASRLSNFHSLKYFRWNFKLTLNEPIIPIQFLYPDELAVDQYEFTVGYWEDWDAIVRVLAAYCPTLEMVAFLEGQMPFVEYRVARTSDGSNRIADIKEEDRSGCFLRAAIYDPSPALSPGWPNV